MIKFVIAGHNRFPEAIKDTGEFISGVEKGIEVCALNSNESYDAYRKKLLTKINDIPGNERILILCDLVGGTPFKAAVQISSEVGEKIRIIAGVNLPGILTGIMLKDSLEINELTEEMVEESKRGIELF